MVSAERLALKPGPVGLNLQPHYFISCHRLGKRA